jgi:hypothetical protein
MSSDKYHLIFTAGGLVQVSSSKYHLIFTAGGLVQVSSSNYQVIFTAGHSHKTDHYRQAFAQNLPQG